MIRFYSPPVGDDEAMEMWLPRQKDRTEAEAIRPDVVATPEPVKVIGPG